MRSLGLRTMMMKDEMVKGLKSALMGYQPLMFGVIASFLDYRDQANLREAGFGEKDVDEDAGMVEAQWRGLDL
ncbi:hypothetical protein EYC80_007640 [Monilinia laxa]|uniref:Uncharacterized protein n=1 Tax=Monilinia laxa TaxID=61186 RepID=A0A5N6JWJ2_MONLA|nr:hypothetical protein EYC80_007640 [Monilinia laxa]